MQNYRPVLMHITLTGSTNAVKHLRVKQWIADRWRPCTVCVPNDSIDLNMTFTYHSFIHSFIYLFIYLLWLFGLHHFSAANNLQSGLSSASLVASSTLRLWYDRSFFIVANQEEWGRPAGLFQSLCGLWNCGKNSPEWLYSLHVVYFYTKMK